METSEQTTWAPSSIKVFRRDFDKYVAENRAAIFHFWAIWDLHDRTMDEALAENAFEYKDRVFIGAVDVDDPDSWSLMKQLRVMNVPALVLFKDGVYIETIVGCLKKETIKNKLELLLMD